MVVVVVTLMFSYCRQTPVLTRSDSRAAIYKSSQTTSPGESQGQVQLESWFLNQLAGSPDLCLHVGMSIALGVLAISTLRMKCFWSPYICVLSSVALADKTLWSCLLSKVSKSSNDGTVNFVRHLVLACVLCLLITKHKPT